MTRELSTIVKTENISDYDIWMRNSTFTRRKKDHAIQEIEKFNYKPLISIAMPVYNIGKEWLKRAIQSVVDQTYSNWELCIVDDASTMREVRRVLNRFSSNDSRIRVKFLKNNLNISGATNEALTLAKGEFVAFLDHDDELHPNALFEVVNVLQLQKETDIIYTDNDLMDTEDKRSHPKFKPDWSPELLLSYMYISHLLVCRMALIREVGGFRIGYEGSQDHDLVLRLSERSQKICHIPKILYHARMLPQSVSGSGDAKPYSFIAGKKAVEDAAHRRGIQASVDRPEFAVKDKCGIYKISFMGPWNSKVAIIIPTKDRVGLLKRCIDSIEAKSTYKNYEIVIANDNSTDEATLKYFGSIRHKVIDVGSEGPFNYSRIMNQSVRQLDGDIEYILFLNNDTEVITENWIEEMLGFMQDPEVGAVGAKLLYPDYRIQHGGVILSLNEGLPGHAFKTLPISSRGYLYYNDVVRNYSAVTGACMLTRRRYFDEIGGFDEANLGEAYNDVDYCLKLRERGYRIVYTPYAILFHHEGASRGKRVPARNEYHFKKKWGGFSVDPYYNPNLEGRLFQVNLKIMEVLPVNRKVKLLFVSHNLNHEGAPLSLFSIAKGLDKNKYDVTVLSPLDGPLKKTYEEQGFNVYLGNFNIYMGMSSIEDIHLEMDKMLQWCQSFKFDLVFCNTLDAFWGVRLAQRMGIPSIWCIRESSDVRDYFAGYFGNTTLTEYAIESLQMPTHIVFVSEETQRLFEKPAPHVQFRVIHNGMDIQEIEKYKNTFSKFEIKKKYGIADGMRVITSVGQMARRKGHDVFIKAGIELLKNMHNVTFLIVGGKEGDYLDEMRELISESGMEQHIKIIPETPDVFPYYMLADIFVCCSYIESLPRVISEAMAFQIPIIATNIFGIKEQIESEMSGILIPPGDPNILCEKLQFLLSNEIAAKELADNAYYRLLSKFNYQNMVKSYERCIQESLFSSVDNDALNGLGNERFKFLNRIMEPFRSYFSL